MKWFSDQDLDLEEIEKLRAKRRTSLLAPCAIARESMPRHVDHAFHQYQEQGDTMHNVQPPAGYPPGR